MGPLDAKLIGALMLIAALIGFGAWIERHNADAEIARLKASYNAQVNAAVNAKAAAEARTHEIESRQSDAVANAIATYSKDQDAQHVQDQAVISALRNGSQRLSVRTATAARDCTLPGAAAGTSASTAPAPETLAEPVAARLAGRYAEYNDVVDELNLCQAIIKTDRLAPAP